MTNDDSAVTYQTSNYLLCQFSQLLGFDQMRPNELLYRPNDLVLES